MSSSEWLALIGPWGVILSGIKMSLLMVEVEIEEVGALLTCKVKGLLVAGKKIVMHL
jgi:hypothetical protein